MTREEFASRLQICRKRLYIAALSVTKNREDAEDALSNATLRALKRYKDFTDTGNFDAWMLTTTMNEAKRLRSSKRYFENADELYDVLDEDGLDEKVSEHADLQIHRYDQNEFVTQAVHGASLESCFENVRSKFDLEEISCLTELWAYTMQTGIAAIEVTFRPDSPTARKARGLPASAT